MSARGGRRKPAAPRSGRGSSTGRSSGTGYGKPPKEYQFQPGQSGNRKGRPKGAKNTAALTRKILDRKIDVRTGGVIRKISLREAMLMRFAEHALKGDTKFAAFLLSHYDMAEAGQEPATGEPTSDEQEIIDKYVEALLKKKGANT